MNNDRDSGERFVRGLIISIVLSTVFFWIPLAILLIKLFGG